MHNSLALFLLRGLPLLALLVTLGCASWVPVAVPLPLADSTRIVGLARLVDSAGKKHVASTGALVVGPSVLFSRADWRPDSIPTSSVVRVERRVGNPAGTVGILVLVVLGAVAAIGLAITASAGGCNPYLGC